MRVLLITPRLPYPPNRGDRLKIFNLISRLSGRHEFHLFALYQDRSELAGVAPLRKLCASVTAVHVPLPRSLMSASSAIPGSRPFQVAYFWSPAAARALEALAARVSCDLLHTHLLRMAPYADCVAGPRRLLDLTDAVTLYWRQFVSVTRNPLLRALRAVELSRVVRYEARAADFDISLVCSERDRAAVLTSAPTARVEILPNGVDVKAFAPEGNGSGARGGEPDTLIYTGNLAYWPNADAILHFCRTVWPRLVSRRPLKLLIVGQRPGARIRGLARLPGVTVTGAVPDMQPWYRRARVAICPIRFGAGTLNKILEPLAIGLPVVTSSDGCAGMGVRAGRELLVADAPEEQAAAILRVLDDPVLAAGLSRAGRAFVETRHDWDAVADRLDGYYRRVAA